MYYIYIYASCFFWGWGVGGWVKFTKRHPIENSSPKPSKLSFPDLKKRRIERVWFPSISLRSVAFSVEKPDRQHSVEFKLLNERIDCWALCFPFFVDNQIPTMRFRYLEYLGWPSDIAWHGFRRGISDCGTQSLSDMPFRLIWEIILNPFYLRSVMQWPQHQSFGTFSTFLKVLDSSGFCCHCVLNRTSFPVKRPKIVEVVRQPCQTWTNVGRTVGSNELGSSEKTW